jgi:hypothetical protein
MSERNESLGEGARGDGSIKSRNQQKIIHLGIVIDVNDPVAAGRIRVKIKGFDDKPEDTPPVPWSKFDPLVCFPFLPLHINIIPKVGETAKIILYDSKNDQAVREYVGPLIPQLGDKLKESLDFPDAKRGRPDFPLTYEKSIKKIVTAQGVYPNVDEIAIQGRDNSDIIFKPSEVLIRAAKFLPDQPTVRNEVNPAYIQLKTINPGKYSTNIDINATTDTVFKKILQQEKFSETRTDINMVSNKIYLIGRDNNSSIVNPYFNEEEEFSLEDKLHPVVYGDILKDFIERLFNWAKSHTHSYHKLPQYSEEPAYIELQRWMTEELPRLNSRNIFAGGDFENNKPKSTVNKQATILPNEAEVRVNSEIQRVDEINSPLISINAVRNCDDNECLVEFDIINNASGEIIIKLEGRGGNQLLAYQQVVTALFSYLVANGINNSDVEIPPINKIKVF